MKTIEDKARSQRIFAQGATIELSNCVVETYPQARNAVDLARAVAAYDQCSFKPKPKLVAPPAFSLMLSNVEDFAFPEPAFEAVAPLPAKTDSIGLLGALAVIALAILVRFALS